MLLDNLLFQPDSAPVRQSYMPKMLHMLNLAGFGMRACASSRSRKGAGRISGMADLSIRLFNF